MPFGIDRYQDGTLYTDYRFTGQRIENDTDLYFYNSRWYDPVVGRFIQPDSIVPEPGNPQALNRYSYVVNNPLRYIDPTGHAYDAGGDYTALFFEPPEQAPYSPYVSVAEGWMSIIWWAFEIGPDTLEFGPNSSLGQNVQHGSLFDEKARTPWAESGYPTSFELRANDLYLDVRDSSVPIGERRMSSAEQFIRAHGHQAGATYLAYKGFLGIPPLNQPSFPLNVEAGTFGSYDSVSVSRAGIDKSGTTWVRIDVVNIMDRASVSRKFGTSGSRLEPLSRSEVSWGGRMTMQFHWYEPVPSP